MPRVRTTAQVLVVAVSLALSTLAAASGGGLAERAEEAMKATDYATAERLFAELAGDPEQRGYATFRRAVALLHLGRLGLLDLEPTARLLVCDAHGTALYPCALGSAIHLVCSSRARERT